MKKVLQKIFYYLGCAVLLAVVFIPLIYWIRNPELTKIQIFIEWWWLYVSAVIMSIIIKVIGHE